ncbi:MAG TPA: hypothetical protein VMH80_25280 [Bryobacteraceae bacterium]|nr:hypothetical protein [Bryobacteraceae bacterium]
MRRTYLFFLLLYPRNHRALFGTEMLRVHQESAAEHRSQGRIAYAAFVVRELAGLLTGAAGAWFGRQPPLPKAQGNVPTNIAEAQRCIDASIAGMVQAIAHHQFEKARFYSFAERKARENLRRLKESYGISD